MDTQKQLALKRETIYMPIRWGLKNFGASYVQNHDARSHMSWARGVRARVPSSSTGRLMREATEMGSSPKGCNVDVKPKETHVSSVTRL